MSRLRLNLWSPLPPSPSGIADYVAEALPHLARKVDLTVVVEDPAAVDPLAGAPLALRPPAKAPPADLDLFEIGNSPAHAFAYRAALQIPGVVVLHEWSLHHLVLHETVERRDVPTYLREMRRAHGETGTFVGRQVARGLGGDLLPSLYPLNDRLLEASLGVVALTRDVMGRASRRLPGRPILHLPHHLALPMQPLPSRQEARAALGLPEEALIVTAPGLATVAKGIGPALRAAGGLRARHPRLVFVVAGDQDPRLPLAEWARDAGFDPASFRATGRLLLPDFVRHLCAADVVLGLRFPSHGEISGALVRALGVGRPVLVTAGTPAAQEFPDGVVVAVDPGPAEEAELRALLDRLLGDASLRERISHLAREHVRRHHELGTTVDHLSDFLEEVAAAKADLLATRDREGTEEGGLVGYLTEEVRWGARDLGLPGVPLDLLNILKDLAAGPRSPE